MFELGRLRFLTAVLVAIDGRDCVVGGIPSSLHRPTDEALGHLNGIHVTSSSPALYFTSGYIKGLLEDFIIIALVLHWGHSCTVAAIVPVAGFGVMRRQREQNKSLDSC